MASQDRPWGRAWEKSEKRPLTAEELARLETVPGDPHVVGRRVVAHLIDLAAAMSLGVVVAIQWVGDVAPASWFASADASVVWMLLTVFLNWVVLQGLTGFSV